MVLGIGSLLLLLICATHLQSSARYTRDIDDDIPDSEFKLIEVDLQRSISSSDSYYKDPSLYQDVACGAGKWNDSAIDEAYKLKDGSSRIAGGFEPKLGWFPSYINVNSTRKKGTPLRCGGVVIDSRTVLTAAHCLEDSIRINLDLRRGFPNRKGRYDIQRGCIPTGYVHLSRGSRHDFAVLRTRKDIKFDEGLQPACLPTRDIAREEKLVVVGNGLMQEDPVKFPKKIRGLRVKLSRCDDEVAPEYTCITKRIGRGNVCEGDSGSAALALRNGKQYSVALVSYGSHECQKNSNGITKYLDLYKDRKALHALIESCT